MQTRLPISLSEFGKLILACKPPTGWGHSKLIAVGYSGGADSTCLLYLLHSWISQNRDSLSGVIAIIVDHSLQKESANTAERCRQFCKNLGIPSRMVRIPWSEAGFPERPIPGRAFETIAREARHQVLFQAMRDSGANILATGHHADDNLETTIMRMATTSVDASRVTPMRLIRRYGMSYGMAGMQSWTVKPLLTIPKDRVLATCEAHGLTCIDDPTNFQPLLTQRNFIRHCLSDKHVEGSPEGAPTLTSEKVWQTVEKMNVYASHLLRSTGNMSCRDHLHHAIHHRMQELEKVDDEASVHLKDIQIPSPLSTFAFSIQSQNHRFISDEVRRAIVLRILRYVSPKPWGSPLAEVSHSTLKLRDICEKLWESTPTKFSSGSEVQWQPMAFRLSRNSAFGIRLIQASSSSEDVRTGWIAYRQKPIIRYGLPDSYVDISDCLNSLQAEQQFLWDNRFLITVRSRIISQNLSASIVSPGKIRIRPNGLWSLPVVEWSREGHDVVILAGLFPTETRNGIILSGHCLDSIRFEHIRILSAL